MDLKQVKIGAVFGLIGAVILLIVGLASFTTSRMYSYGNIPIFIPYITSIVTAAVAAIGIYGAITVIRDNPTGYTFLLIAGIVGIVCTFIPIYAYDDGYGWIQTFYLSTSGMFIDLVLMLVGGILGFALAEKKERIE